MTKDEYLQLAESKWEALQSLQSEESFYEYEKRFDGVMQELNRELLERSIGEVPADRRKKKSPNTVRDDPDQPFSSLS